MGTAVISARIDPLLLREVDLFAGAASMTRGDVVKRALNAYMARVNPSRSRIARPSKR